MSPSFSVLSTSTPRSTARGWRRAGVWAAALVAGALFAGAALLWWHNGTTVFFDTMAAGIGSCM